MPVAGRLPPTRGRARTPTTRACGSLPSRNRRGSRSCRCTTRPQGQAAPRRGARHDGPCRHTPDSRDRGRGRRQPPASYARCGSATTRVVQIREGRQREARPRSSRYATRRPALGASRPERTPVRRACARSRDSPCPRRASEGQHTMSVHGGNATTPACRTPPRASRDPPTRDRDRARPRGAGEVPRATRAPVRLAGAVRSLRPHFPRRWPPVWDLSLVERWIAFARSKS